MRLMLGTKAPYTYISVSKADKVARYLDIHAQEGRGERKAVYSSCISLGETNERRASEKGKRIPYIKVCLSVRALTASPPRMGCRPRRQCIHKNKWRAIKEVLQAASAYHNGFKNPEIILPT